MRAAREAKQPAKKPAAIELEAELARIAAMNINELRDLWREREGREAPRGFGRSMPLGYRTLNKQLEVVPEEAEVVRKLFALYVELGSVGDVARALDRQGVRPKPGQLANGHSKAAERYTIGPLAHMVKNPMYVGEVAYRGEVHKGEHPTIIDREVFDRVQAMLAERRQDNKKGEFTASSDRAHIR